MSLSVRLRWHNEQFYLYDTYETGKYIKGDKGCTMNYLKAYLIFLKKI